MKSLGTNKIAPYGATDTIPKLNPFEKFTRIFSTGEPCGHPAVKYRVRLVGILGWPR